jgi:hypothetical protein
MVVEVTGKESRDRRDRKLGAPADLERIQRVHDAHDAHVAVFLFFNENLDLLRTPAARDPTAVVSTEVTCPSRVLNCTELEIDGVDEASGDPFGIQARAADPRA